MTAKIGECKTGKGIGKLKVGHRQVLLSLLSCPAVA